MMVRAEAARAAKLGGNTVENRPKRFLPCFLFVSEEKKMFVLDFRWREGGVSAKTK